MALDRSAFAVWLDASGVPEEERAHFEEVAELLVTRAGGGRVLPKHVDEAVRELEKKGASAVEMALVVRVGRGAIQCSVSASPASPRAPRVAAPAIEAPEVAAAASRSPEAPAPSPKAEAPAPSAGPFERAPKPDDSPDHVSVSFRLNRRLVGPAIAVAISVALWAVAIAFAPPSWGPGHRGIVVSPGWSLLRAVGSLLGAFGVLELARRSGLVERVPVLRSWWSWPRGDGLERLFALSAYRSAIGVVVAVVGFCLVSTFLGPCSSAPPEAEPEVPVRDERVARPPELSPGGVWIHDGTERFGPELVGPPTGELEEER